jgi:outer membrane lipoprotein SlyB
MKYAEKCLHTFAIAAVVGLGLGLGGVAHADTVNGNVTDHYKTIIDQTPYKVEVCKDVVVSGDKTKDTLTGAIIGGVIGNNVTKNVENGAAVGALLGGIIGHNNSKATGGTKRVCSIETRYEESQREVYSHSTLTFVYEGRHQTVKFFK